MLKIVNIIVVVGFTFITNHGYSQRYEELFAAAIIEDFIDFESIITKVNKFKVSQYTFDVEKDTLMSSGYIAFIKNEEGIMKAELFNSKGKRIELTYWKVDNAGHYEKCSKKGKVKKYKGISGVLEKSFILNGDSIYETKQYDLYSKKKLSDTSYHWQDRYIYQEGLLIEKWNYLHFNRGTRKWFFSRPEKNITVVKSCFEKDTEKGKCEWEDYKKVKEYDNNSNLISQKWVKKNESIEVPPFQESYYFYQKSICVRYEHIYEGKLEEVVITEILN